MSAPERGQPGTWQHLALWDGGGIALEATLAQLPCSDADAGRAILAEYPGWLHCRHVSGWHVWDGRCHRPDESDMISQVAVHWADRMAVMLDRARQQVTARVMTAGDGLTDAQLRRECEKAWEPWKAAEKYAAGVGRNAGRTALCSYMAAMATVPEASMDDRWPELLNVANGILDLRTGRLWPHDPAAGMTYCLDTPYVPGARCPGFASVLMTVCGGDEQVAAYLLRLLGYALLGDNRDQRVVFLSGPTGNGKSTLLRIVSGVLGTLAHESQAGLITVTRHGRNARTENSIRGRRLITITETSEYMSIEEAQLKRLTGERVISVDQHYAKTELRTIVSWLIMIATNQLPSLTNFDDAVRRRVIVIPCGPTVPAHLVDNTLAEKIMATEREGILALLAAAAGEYFRCGLDDAPAAVRDMAGQYASSQDTVAMFLADCMTFSANGSSPGIPSPAMWNGYQKWARGTPHLGRTQFHARMREASGVAWIESVRLYQGVTWKPGFDPAYFG